MGGIGTTGRVLSDVFSGGLAEFGQLAKDDKGRSWSDQLDEADAEHNQRVTDWSIPIPKPAGAETLPSITDEAVRARQASQTLSLLAGRGRRQAFAGGGGGTGPLGAGSMLGGY